MGEDTPVYYTARIASAALAELMYQLGPGERDTEHRHMYHVLGQCRKNIDQNLLLAKGDREEDMGSFSWVERGHGRGQVGQSPFGEEN